MNCEMATGRQPEGKKERSHRPGSPQNDEGYMDRARTESWLTSKSRSEPTYPDTSFYPAELFQRWSQPFPGAEE